MKARFFFIVVACFAAFFLGWVLSQKRQTTDPGTKVQTEDSFVDTAYKADTMKSSSLAHKISGRFILYESNYAGFNFISTDTVLWTNEIAYNDPDTLKLRWLTDSIFITRTTKRMDEKCPPGVDIYKVVGFDGYRLRLAEIWTGWNDADDGFLEFVKQSN